MDVDTHDLKITDIMRYTTINTGNGATNARNVLIRMDTNQGIYGLGEVRDSGDARFALFLKKVDYWVSILLM